MSDLPDEPDLPAGLTLDDLRWAGAEVAALRMQARLDALVATMPWPARVCFGLLRRWPRFRRRGPVPAAKGPTMSTPWTPMAEALHTLMSDLSEQCWAAGWLNGTEEAIWDLIHGHRDRWGMCTREQILGDLRAIDAVAGSGGCWITMGDDGAPVAIELAAWESRMHTR